MSSIITTEFVQNILLQASENRPDFDRAMTMSSQYLGMNDPEFEQKTAAIGNTLGDLLSPRLAESGAWGPVIVGLLLRSAIEIIASVDLGEDKTSQDKDTHIARFFTSASADMIFEYFTARFEERAGVNDNGRTIQ